MSVLVCTAGHQYCIPKAESNEKSPGCIIWIGKIEVHQQRAQRFDKGNINMDFIVARIADTVTWQHWFLMSCIVPMKLKKFPKIHTQSCISHSKSKLHASNARIRLCLDHENLSQCYYRACKVVQPRGETTYLLQSLWVGQCCPLLVDISSSCKTTA